MYKPYYYFRAFFKKDIKLLTFFIILICFFSVQSLAGQSTGNQNYNTTGIIRGVIVDSRTQNPLPGASILMKGTNRGTASKRDGSYEFNQIPSGKQTLVVSFIGYQRKEVTVQVKSGQIINRDIKLESKTLGLGELVVTGLRGGQIRAINQKRQAINVMDAVSADEIGKLPAENVAEAVQRIAGVSIQTSRGEGRFVTIRGGEPNLNNVTLNGKTMASTASSRATSLDLLPAEMVASVEVIKAITPDMDATGIGGAINVNTLSALDRNQPFAFGAFEGLFHNQQYENYGDDKFPYRASITAGTQFGTDNKIGLVVSANASRRDYTATIFSPESWAPFEEGSSFYIPEEQENYVEDNERERYGLSTEFNYNINQNTFLSVQGYYTRTVETVLNSLYQTRLGPDYGGELIARNGKMVQYDAGFSQVSLSSDLEEENLWGTTITGEHNFGAFSWEVSGTYTRGILDRFNSDTEFSTNFFDFNMGEGPYQQLGHTIDAGDPFFDVIPENALFISEPSIYIANEFDRESESNTENTYAATTDLKWNTQVGAFAGFLKTGFKLQIRDKVIDVTENQYGRGNTPVTLASIYNPLYDPIQGGSILYMNGNPKDADQLFRELCGSAGKSDNLDIARCNSDEYFVLNEREAITEAVEQDSDNQESIYAGYVMGQFSIGDLTVLGGVRLEYTNTEVQRYRLDINDDTDETTLAQETFESSYINILPSVHLKYSATDNIVLRAAWSNTIGRADYADLAGFREVEFQEVSPEVFRGGVEEGNPNLKPYKAMNLDLTAEYYFNNGGLFSLSGFYKYIKNPIYFFLRTRENIDFEGRFYELITFGRQENAEDGIIRGIEVSYQQPFTFLPAPLNGLGIAANVTFVDSEVDVPLREGDDLPFFRQSDLIYNIIPYFQKSGFQFRVAINYRGGYLDEISEISIEDQYAGNRQTIDLSASYEFDENLFPGGARLKLIGKVRNLTNAAETVYQGRPGQSGVSSEAYEELLEEHVLTGRTVTLGLSLTF